MKLKTWIITLNATNPVVVTLQQQLAAQGVAAELFPAVDGRSHTPSLQGDEKLAPMKALLNRRALLSASELGCYLSHYRAIRQAFDEGYEYVCIFEDDVVAEPGLVPLISDLMATKTTPDMVRFMSLKTRRRKVIQQINENYLLVRPVRGALGTQGYLLSRPGMHKVLLYGAEISMAIDKLYDSFFMFNLHCYCVEPHAIYEQAKPSTVTKHFSSPDHRLWVWLGWRLNKLYRSIWRHCHRLRHFKEFSPAAMPVGPQGKSARIR